MSTKCCNADCADDAVFILELGLINSPARSMIFLCARDFNRLLAYMGIKVVEVKSSEPVP
jgi:hypothetical protein